MTRQDKGRLVDAVGVSIVYRCVSVQPNATLVKLGQVEREYTTNKVSLSIYQNENEGGDARNMAEPFPSNPPISPAPTVCRSSGGGPGLDQSISGPKLHPTVILSFSG